jgi:hypothetical protein
MICSINQTAYVSCNIEGRPRRSDTGTLQQLLALRSLDWFRPQSHATSTCRRELLTLFTPKLQTKHSTVYTHRKHGDHFRNNDDSQLVPLPHHTRSHPSPQSANRCKAKHRPRPRSINATRNVSLLQILNTSANCIRSPLPANSSPPPLPSPSSPSSSPSLGSPT